MLNHAGARKIELNRAIQIGKGETTEGALLISTDIPALLLFMLPFIKHWSPVCYSNVVGRRRRTKKVEEGTRTKSTTHAIFW